MHFYFLHPGCQQRCRHIPTRRVCGSDGFIYRNFCQLKKSACLEDVRLEKVPYSWCKLSLELQDDGNSDEHSDSDSREGKRRRTWGPDSITLATSTQVITQRQQTTTPTVVRTTKLLISHSEESTSTEEVPNTPVPRVGTPKTTILPTKTGTTRIPTTGKPPTTVVPQTTKVPTTPIQTTRVPTTRPKPTTRRACPSVCPLVLEPVCGTDGQTYTSECVLQAESCHNNDISLQVAYEGPCIVTLQPIKPQK